VAAPEDDAAVNEWDIVGRICAALILGGLIGAEREAKGHVAGLRTYMLVSLGAALFMVASEQLTLRYHQASPFPDPTRVASTIVTGVSFLGAGVIFQSRTRIRNLTTAAGIWVVAAIGMLAGSGFYVTAVSGTLVTLIVLAWLPRLERWINRRARPGAGADLDASTRLDARTNDDAEA
jgi:putative Mg2+ transporter-C (MgtC) family protein